MTGGTDCHLILWDLRPLNIDGAMYELVAEECLITVNKNTVPGDKSAMKPGGIRIGESYLPSNSGQRISDRVLLIL